MVLNAVLERPHYSYHRIDGLKVRHSESITIAHFEHFLETARPYDFDIVLEIKDKEASALKAVELARNDQRFFHE